MIDRDTTAIEAKLSALSPTTVLGLLTQALGGSGWDKPDWQYTRLTRSVGAATAGIFRLSGTAELETQPHPWSCILKAISPGAVGISGAPCEDQTHPLYWRREVLAYQSGWLNHLPGGIRGPRCLGTETQTDGSVWLWLEDVPDRFGGQWPIQQYAHAARSLGRFNGAYLAGQPWPAYAWLSRIGHEPRGVIEAYGWLEGLVRNPATWEHPLLRTTFPKSLVAGLARMWDNRFRLLEALERLPQTVCHQDAWRGNLNAPVGGGDDELVMIDWSYAGRSVLGADLGDLAVGGYGDMGTGLSLAAVDATVFESYLEGLCEAGLAADRKRVRFAYITFAALKYGCLMPMWLRDMANEERRAFWEWISGQPIESYVRQQAIILEHLLRLHGEAVGLLGAL